VRRRIAAVATRAARAPRRLALEATHPQNGRAAYCTHDAKIPQIFEIFWKLIGIIYAA
jgi:hypothetical protein